MTHWRGIRARLLAAGVSDPLTLPSMHHLLDITEKILLEGMSKQDDVQRYYYRTYQPEPEEMMRSGFSEEETMESFEAFSAALGDMH